MLIVLYDLHSHKEYDPIPFEVADAEALLRSLERAADTVAATRILVQKWSHRHRSLKRKVGETFRYACPEDEGVIVYSSSEFRVEREVYCDGAADSTPDDI